MNELGYFTSRTRIAYLSMEIALRAEIHTYSGGLGVLAGDTVRSCSDLGLPVVFVTLISRAGYFRQEIGPDGDQREHPDYWNPAEFARPLPAMVGVNIEDRIVWVRPWLYIHKSSRGQEIPVLLLDTDLDQNSAEDRTLTHFLYGGDEAYRLKQEIVLGIGGVRILDALSFELQTYHMNEGHAALLTVELLRRYRRNHAIAGFTNGSDSDRVRELCTFTTHTPVDAGHDRFSYELFARIAGEIISIDELRSYAGLEKLDMTRLALNLSTFINGVAYRHAETTRTMFPGYDIRAITNGIHSETWAHSAFATLYDAKLPRWWHDPEILVRADQLSDDAVWSAHRAAKRDLSRAVKELTGCQFDPELPTIGFARRMTGYKRPNLLFSDVDKLTAIAEKHPFQIVMAGKAHPRDAGGKEAIRNLHSVMRHLSKSKIPIAFIPNYNMNIAKLLVAGTDVWLNTPTPPMEASGTSGMKAALNGVLNLSTLDGWWIEGCIDGVTGWSIGDGSGKHDGDANALYARLQSEVLPLYETDRCRWIWMMKQAISKLASYFNSQRMMRRYATEAYVR